MYIKPDDTLSTEDLQRYLRNALKTGCTCGGHSKAQSNYIAANKYRDELNRRGLNLPTFDLAIFVSKSECKWYWQQVKLGVFNGAGAD